VRQVAPQNAGQNSLVSYFPRARALVRRRPAPTVAWIVPRVAHRHVRHDHAHRMRAAATLSRVWSRRAPPRGASGRAAERGIKFAGELFPSRAPPPRVRTSCARCRVGRTACRAPLCAPRHAHRTRVADIVMCVHPCRWPWCGAPCRAAKRGARKNTRDLCPSRPRPVRQSPAPTAAWVAPSAVHRRVRLETRAPCGCGGHCVARMPTPRAAARCVVSRRESAGS
jgi:hypothetical protein